MAILHPGLTKDNYYQIHPNTGSVDGHQSKPTKATTQGVDQGRTLKEAGYVPVDGAPPPLPLAIPKFSMKELRAAIPKHCFKRSLGTSASYLLKDLVICLALLLLAIKVEGMELPALVRWIVWPTYWFLQGIHLTALWILGHECGHHAFSDYEWLDDSIGLVLHSMLLTPFHSWKISHRHHHAGVGSMENDEVFVPMTRTEYDTWLDVVEDSVEDTPIFNLGRIIAMLLVGWMPGYLVFNATGPKKYVDQPKSHFNPQSALFSDRERHLIVLSDVGVGVALGGLVFAAMQTSLGTIGRLFVVPFMVVNACIVIFTLLHHTDTFVPRFRGDAWSWLHGALCTVDRDFGPVLNGILHHMPDTHVCHHLFSRMPFYHAVEATRCLRPLLGPYYLVDRSPLPVAFWRAYTQCKFVEDEGDAVFCKKTL